MHGQVGEVVPCRCVWLAVMPSGVRLTSADVRAGRDHQSGSLARAGARTRLRAASGSIASLASSLALKPSSFLCQGITEQGQTLISPIS